MSLKDIVIFVGGAFSLDMVVGGAFSLDMSICHTRNIFKKINRLVFGAYSTRHSNRILRMASYFELYIT